MRSPLPLVNFAGTKTGKAKFGVFGFEKAKLATVEPGLQPSRVPVMKGT